MPCWFDLPARPEMVNVRTMPDDDPEPLEVIEVCLPFVAVRKPDRTVHTLDIRRHELARLDDTFARRVIKRLRAPQHKKPRPNDES